MTRGLNPTFSLDANLCPFYSPFYYEIFINILILLFLHLYFYICISFYPFPIQLPFHFMKYNLIFNAFTFCICILYFNVYFILCILHLIVFCSNAFTGFYEINLDVQWNACPSSPMRLKIRIDPFYDSFKDINRQTKVEIVESHFMTPSRT